MAASKDDQAARKARAERLRKQIARGGATPGRPETPRDFINRRTEQLKKRRG